jgi:hypothetical protein
MILFLYPKDKYNISMMCCIVVNIIANNSFCAAAFCLVVGSIINELLQECQPIKQKEEEADKSGGGGYEQFYL